MLDNKHEGQACDYRHQLPTHLQPAQPATIKIPQGFGTFYDFAMTVVVTEGIVVTERGLIYTCTNVNIY